MRTLRRRRIASVRVFMTDHIPDFAIVLGLSLFSLPCSSLSASSRPPGNIDSAIAARIEQDNSFACEHMGFLLGTEMHEKCRRILRELDRQHGPALGEAYDWP